MTCLRWERLSLAATVFCFARLKVAIFNPRSSLYSYFRNSTLLGFSLSRSRPVVSKQILLYYTIKTRNQSQTNPRIHLNPANTNQMAPLPSLLGPLAICHTNPKTPQKLPQILNFPTLSPTLDLFFKPTVNLDQNLVIHYVQ